LNRNGETIGKMFGILVVSHGHLAEELVEAARTIVGQIDSVIPVSIGWNQDMEKARETIQKAIDKVSGDGQVIILTDMFGGTPTNISLSFLREGMIEVVTGVNLPMMIKLASLQKEGADIVKAAKAIKLRGQQSIVIASETLNSKEAPTPQ
jgi:PTS system mannose-specific IIA component